MSGQLDFLLGLGSGSPELVSPLEPAPCEMKRRVGLVGSRPLGGSGLPHEYECEY